MNDNLNNLDEHANDAKKNHSPSILINLPFLKWVLEIIRSYAAVLFLKSTFWGLLIALSLWLSPNIAMAGLLGLLIGTGVTAWLKLPTDNDGLYLFNALLVGLSVGAFYQLNSSALVLLVISVTLVVLVGHTMSTKLWHSQRLPAFSLPFVVVAFLTYFASLQFDSLQFHLPSFAKIPFLPHFSIHSEIKSFLETLGAIFFIPHGYIGLLILAALLVHSRYLVFLAITGYALGLIVLRSLMSPMTEHLLAWSGFNFALAAMAVGGILTVPSLTSFLLAMLAAAFAALFTIGLFTLLTAFSIPVLAAPFVLATLTIISALKFRLHVNRPQIAEPPALPEINYERARLARFRNGELGSTPLLAPILGKWDIYQGVNGPHTHKREWQYALDFYILKDNKSFEGAGAHLDDFHCFGLPVVSPVFGTVIRCNDTLPDNKPGEMDTHNNWGNFILIALDNGLVVMLAHLKQHSIKVKEKQRVSPVDILAACGNSGRSPQSHLHLQVQRDATLFSPTRPFHLASVLLSANKTTSYQVTCIPNVGEAIESAVADKRLAHHLHLPVGRVMEYEWQADKQSVPTHRKLTVKVTFEGQYRLHGDKGASAAFSEDNGVLAFYDRTGPSDLFFDTWLLAMGLTPLSESAINWKDSPSAHLLNTSLLQALLLSIRFPLGCGLNSYYERTVANDLIAADVERNMHWRQTGFHQLPSLFKANNPTNSPTSNFVAKTTALIDSTRGCYALSLEMDQHIAEAKLRTIGLIEDEGIPGWKEAIHNEH